MVVGVASAPEGSWMPSINPSLAGLREMILPGGRAVISAVVKNKCLECHCQQVLVSSKAPMRSMA